MSSTTSATRPRFMAVLLLLVTFLSFLGFSSAAPVGHASSAVAPYSVAKRADNDPFSQKNVIRTIRAMKGRKGFIFYQSPHGPQAHALADSGSSPSGMQYYGFDDIYDSNVLRAIGNPDKSQTNDAMKMSIYMAEAARGDVGIVGGEPPNRNSFWIKYELPILQENMKAGKITSIRYYLPGEENIDNFYAVDILDQRSGKIVRRSNPNWRASNCRRQGSCMTSESIEKLVDAMNAADDADPIKLPTDIPDLKATLDAPDEPVDQTDPTKPAPTTEDPTNDPNKPKTTTQNPTDPEAPADPSNPQTPDAPDSQTPDQPDSQTPTDPNDPNKPKTPKTTKPGGAKPPKA